MPLREYNCKSCNNRWEIIQGHHEADPTHCPKCNSTSVDRMLGAPSFHFKGSGWSRPESKPEFNVMVNPDATTYDEKFKVIEKTPTNTKEAQEIHREASKVNGVLGAEKTPPATK